MLHLFAYSEMFQACADPWQSPPWVILAAVQSKAASRNHRAAANAYCDSAQLLKSVGVNSQLASRPQPGRVFAHAHE